MRAFCALAVLLIAALAASPTALAAPATEEYDLALPEADGGDGSGSAEDESDAAVAPPTSAPPTAPAPETVAPAIPATPDEGDKKRGEGGGGGGNVEQPDGSLFASPAPDQPIENIKTSGSGDGGFPALLLLLGAIAGTCAGFAIWRIRRETTESPRGPSGPSVTSGTQSP